MKIKIAIEIISFLIILLFVYAAMSKLLAFDKFRIELNQSPTLASLSGWIVWAIPSIELALAILLMISKSRLIALYASFTLMVMFTVYIAVTLSFADHVPCSCGGILGKMGWTTHMIFNMLFVLMAGAGVVMSDDQSEKTTTDEQNPSPDWSNQIENILTDK